jgi:hypothetical protein
MVPKRKINTKKSYIIRGKGYNKFYVALLIKTGQNLFEIHKSSRSREILLEY